MSLPPAFAKPEDYIQESVLFFKENQHLYNFPNTDILVDNILDKIDINNLEHIDIFKSDFDLKDVAENNGFIEEFFAKLERFKVSYDDFTEDKDLERNVEVPLSPKKRHEIVYLVKEITEVCNECGCDTVVDFGSGLGYLDQLIYETTNFKVLGIECNESHYVGAKKRQRKYHSNSIEKVKYIKHFISENSDENIIEYLNDKFENHGGFCITGLHACADLTIEAVNLFLKMADAKAMVLMPCCYHKMRSRTSDKQRFDNFPLSECSKEIYEKWKGYEFMRVPFLRLAAQPPCRSDDNLEDAVFNLISRAVLQLYARKHILKLKRNKRKAVKTKTLHNDFSCYIQDAANGFTLMPTNGETSEKSIEFNQEELTDIWREIANELTFKKAGIFILMQNYLQPVIENFVLFDRLLYLKENGVDNCSFKKIFNEVTSPRCLALVALK